MYKLLSTLLFVAFICSLGFSQKKNNMPNLLENGNFAKGTEGWSIYLSEPNVPIKAKIIEQSGAYNLYGLADNYIGTNFVELDSKSAIQQKSTVNKGEPHVLVFAYAHRPNAGDKQLIVQIDGKAVWTKTIKNEVGNGKFTYKVIKFVPSNDNTLVSFYAVSLNGDEDKGILLTDVLLNEEPVVDLDLFYEY